MVDKDPFPIPDPRLLIAKSFVNLQEAHFLIDIGCPSNVISDDSCKKLGIDYRAEDGYKIVIANRARQEVGVAISPVEVQNETFWPVFRVRTHPRSDND